MRMKAMTKNGVPTAINGILLPKRLFDLSLKYPTKGSAIASTILPKKTTPPRSRTGTNGV
jgi:hypothetical protein